MTKLPSEINQWIVGLRRDFHRHPETALAEERTSDVILRHLSDLGIAAARFDDMTGVVGYIPGSRPGPVLGIRADIDALPMEELAESEYKSQNPGAMHACGHDMHAAMLLGLARVVMETGLPARMRGGIKLFFQPAEETGRGAAMMIERGAMTDPAPSRVLACHVSGDLPLGRVGVFPGPSHASNDIFHITLLGKGAHAARPHQGRDPILAASHLVIALQSIVSRNCDPMEAAVVSVTRLTAGTTINVIPESVTITGTIRAFAPAIRRLAIERLEELSRGLAAGFGMECRVETEPLFPPAVNDPEVAGFVARAAEKVVGAGNVVYPRPVTGSEDYALFMQKAPGAIFALGCGGPDRRAVLHSPHFNPDEAALAIGVEVFWRAARDYLETPE